MNVAGLFAGIAGLELGLSRAGHNPVLLCENDPAALAVLRRRIPGVPLHTDVRDLKKLPAETELLAAGFPCQDLSQAGQTKGIRGRNSGLISEVFRLLAKSDVPHVLLENVPFILALNKGEAIRLLTGELESLGYSWAYRIVDSRAFGLPQRRQRFFLFASKELDPGSVLFADDALPDEPSSSQGRACGFYWTEGLRGLGWAVDATPPLKGGSTIGIPSPPAIWLPNGAIVTPDIRDAERLQGFAAGWTAPAADVARQSARWKLIGNAVSVPVAAWLGKALNARQRKARFDSEPFDYVKKWPCAAFGAARMEVRRAHVSMFPMHKKSTSLSSFLRFEPKPLSYKATAGFLSRLESGKLRFPEEFLRALQLHKKRMFSAEQKAA